MVTRAKNGLDRWLVGWALSFISSGFFAGSRDFSAVVISRRPQCPFSSARGYMSRLLTAVIIIASLTACEGNLTRGAPGGGGASLGGNVAGARVGVGGSSSGAGGAT